MASFGHCGRCRGHYGMCTDHTACSQCNCPPMGWRCPVCNSGVAPDVKKCPCSEASAKTEAGVVFGIPGRVTYEVVNGRVVQSS